ncbi:MAG: GNAT family N-acetyltransferase [Sphingobacteriales bacterium]|nr:MAG: GNAT family N-acetyltransferase [Sphingobacteriales bacterium]
MHPVYIITTAHHLYEQVIALRQRVLRAPLGLDILNDDLEAEVQQIIFIYEKEGQVKGCVLLAQYDAETFKMRQMAVDSNEQGKGIGAELINAADMYAVNQGKSRIILHARETAIPFYEKLGYEAEGDTFTEVGLPHRKMEKLLA